jgi:hypothetical protein
VGGWRVGYASIELCLSRPAFRPANIDCRHWIQQCFTHVPADARGFHRLPGVNCSFLWYASVSTVYQYNGRHVKREWVDCSTFGSIRIVVHVHWCGSTRGTMPFGVSNLAVGEDLDVVAKNIVQTTHFGRMEIGPSGRVEYYGT